MLAGPEMQQHLRRKHEKQKSQAKTETIASVKDRVLRVYKSRDGRI